MKDLSVAGARLLRVGARLRLVRPLKEVFGGDVVPLRATDAAVLVGLEMRLTARFVRTRFGEAVIARDRIVGSVVFRDLLTSVERLLVRV